MKITTARLAAAAATALAAAGTVAAAAPAHTTAVPRNTGQPSISGRTTVGRTLQANNGTWAGSPTSFRYQWLRCDNPGKTNCHPVSGATSRRYTLVGADAGHTFVAAVTACNGDGCTTAQTDAVGPVAPRNPPRNTAAPSISGNPVAGSLQTANPGSWTNAPTRFTYQWLRCDTTGSNCGAIGGATAHTYGTTPDDVGSTLRVRVTAHNSRGTGTATSGQTAVIGTGTGGSAVPVNTISLPNRLTVSGIEFTPRVLRSRAPFVARFRVTDSRGRPIQGALVYAIALPYGWVRNAAEVASDNDGWATITFSPTRLLPRRASVVFFVRARKPGEPLLGGISTRRLVQVLVRI